MWFVGCFTGYSFRGFVVWALMFALLVLLLGVVVRWFGLFVMCLVCVDVIVFLVNSCLVLLFILMLFWYF